MELELLKLRPSTLESVSRVILLVAGEADGWALHLALLALQLNVVASQLGHDVQQTIVESSKFAVLSLTRVGGVSGELEATPTADFVFENTTVRWADGDASLKPVTAIWFSVNDTNPDPAPNSSLRSTEVRLLPDGDGGLLRFTFVPRGATEPVNLVSYVATVQESLEGRVLGVSAVGANVLPTQLAQFEVLGFLEPTPGDVKAGVKLELDDCGQLMATRVVDFDYFPSTEAAVWEDGETDRQCLAYAIKSDEAANALANHQDMVQGSSRSVFACGKMPMLTPDCMSFVSSWVVISGVTSSETDEVICLRVVALDNSTARKDFMRWWVSLASPVRNLPGR
ncbi:hypothetical protein AK812_SmicGene15420 [Symbiodinium microadriaticum]|uniref:Uncharacterized protein n=1 Tax=Symbiodinium microadriaticum TaxID=2951 RepID=A0A1Q9E2Z3_SYMMI|nr:hypothetical protein AK812_SmicGene15420 [Symbiodinium microadriaticum]